MTHEPTALSLVDLPASVPCPARLVRAGAVFASASRLVATADAPAQPSGAGWFDSSWELRRGLEVHEGWPGEAGLDEWIAGFLALSPGSRAAPASPPRR